MTIRLPRARILLILLATFVFVALGADSCQGAAQQQNTETNQVDKQQALYLQVQPVPFFNFSVERDEYIQIYQARMRAVDTYSVVVSMTGKVLWSCPSKGYPIPYTTQLTNPVREFDAGINNGWAVVLNQAEPNGLFTGTTSATWVLCVRQTPGGGVQIVPTYAEPEVLSFSHPVQIVDGNIVDPGQPASVSITIKTPTPTPSK